MKGTKKIRILEPVVKRLETPNIFPGELPGIMLEIDFIFNE
jgi:hypothetical protein